MAQLRVNNNVTPPLVVLVAGLANVAADVTAVPTITITHGRDGQHRPGSLHGLDAALDVRTHNFPSTRSKDAFVQSVRAKFPPPTYDVILEDRDGPNEHLHIEDNRAKLIDVDTQQQLA